MSDTQAQSVFAPEGPIDVLHVDDDDQFADTLAEYLEEVFGGFRVTHVETAADALAVVEQSAGAGVSDGSVDTGVSASDVDCIVSDYRLPGMDGLELSEAVAQRQSGVPFLLLTGRGSESVASEAMETAVTGYLPKRGDREGFGRLADRIRSAVERTHTRVSYREVFDKAGVGLTVRDTDTGRLLAVNDAYCELLGHDRDELLAGRADVLLDGVDDTSGDGSNDGDNGDGSDGSDDGDNSDGGDNGDGSDGGDNSDDDRVAAFRRALSTGSATATWEAETADGEQVCLDVGYEIAEIGGRRRVLESVNDVTRRRQREAELATQNERIQSLHDAATRVQACETADCVYDEIVRAAEEILAFDIVVVDSVDGDLLVPEAVSVAISEDEYYETTPVDAEDNLAAEAFREQEPSVVDDLRAEAVTPADTAFRAALTLPIGEHGVFQAVSREVGAFDETDLELTGLLLAHAREALSRLERERELRERTRELRREKERSEVFASVVSHDLRNPLNVASGHLSLERERRDSDSLAAVASALDRMEAITEDVLTLAHEGTTVEQTELLSLPAFVTDCWQNVDTPAATVETRLPDGVQIEADPRRVRHILENLFRNAVEHAGEDARITVGVIETTDDAADASRASGVSTADSETDPRELWDATDHEHGHRLVGFYVADDGPGVPAGSREEVFEPGYSTADDGTGFGLAIVREMAVAHGWDVSVTDGEDGGARFEFTGVDCRVTADD